MEPGVLCTKPGEPDLNWIVGAGADEPGNDYEGKSRHGTPNVLQTEYALAQYHDAPEFGAEFLPLSLLARPRFRKQTSDQHGAAPGASGFPAGFVRIKNASTIMTPKTPSPFTSATRFS